MQKLTRFVVALSAGLMSLCPAHSAVWVPTRTGCRKHSRLGAMDAGTTRPWTQRRIACISPARRIRRWLILKAGKSCSTLRASSGRTERQSCRLWGAVSSPTVKQARSWSSTLKLGLYWAISLPPKTPMALSTTRAPTACWCHVAMPGHWPSSTHRPIQKQPRQTWSSSAANLSFWGRTAKEWRTSP